MTSIDPVHDARVVFNKPGRLARVVLLIDKED